MNEPFTKVSDAVRDALTAFPKQREKVAEVLRVTQEIVQIIRERGHEEFEKDIAQIERDCRIVASRLNFIEDRLGCIDRKIAEARRSGSHEKLQEVCNTFMEWFWINREFVAAFRDAEFRWVEQEDAIFEAIEEA